MDINEVLLKGRLGQDPEAVQLASGANKANLRVATTAAWTDRRTSERKERTVWHRVVLWGQPAKFACEYARKGAEVFLRGRSETREYEDKNTGQKKYVTEVVANNFELLRNPQDAQESAGAQPQQAPAPAQASAPAQPQQASAPAAPAASAQAAPAQPAPAPAQPANFADDDDIPF